jgi:hypothetical protein
LNKRDAYRRPDDGDIDEAGTRHVTVYKRGHRDAKVVEMETRSDALLFVHYVYGVRGNDDMQSKI